VASLAIGLAVDGLIDGSRAGLWFFVGPRLSNTAVSFVRQRYESRTFNTLYVRETASELVYAEPIGALRETLLEIPVHEVMAILVRCCFQLPASRCTVRPDGFLDRE